MTENNYDLSMLENSHSISLRRRDVECLVHFLIAPPSDPGENAIELSGILAMLIIADTATEEQPESE